jgi:DNA-binding NarL/FixJ family response regulator
MASDARPVRVLVADDHRLFAEALAVILAGESGVECVGLAADGREALRKAKELEPDVVLMDISMPVLDGIEATRRLRRRQPDVAVLVLTGSSAEQDVAHARAAGAVGYVTKDSIAASLVDAIRAAAGR